MHDNHRHHSRLFYRYLLSYIIIVVLIISIIALVVFNTTLRTLKHEAERAGMAILQSAVYEVDSLMSEMGQISTQISNNPLFAPYLLANDVNRQIEAIRLLRFYQASSSYVEEIALFYGNSPGTIYTSGGVIGLPIFFSTRYQFHDWDEQEFREQIRGMRNAALRATSSVLEFGSADKRFLVYVVPFPMSSYAPYGACLFLLKAPAVERIFANLLYDYEGYALILDQEGKVLFDVSRGGSAYSETEYPIIWGDIATDTRYTMLEIQSEYGYTYSAALLNTRLYRQVDRNRILLIFTIVALVLFGFFMTYVFSSILYKPIRELAGSTMETGILVKDELAAIAGRITSITVENNNLRNMLDRGTALVKERLILSLLYRDDETKRAPFDLARIDFKYGNFCVLIAAVHEGSENTKVVRFSLVSVWEEFAREIGLGVCQKLMETDAVGMIFNCEAPVRPKVVQLGEKIVRFFSESFGIDLTIAIGVPVMTVDSVHESYLSARKVMEYSLLYPEESVLMFDRIDVEIPSIDSFFLTEDENAIIRHVRAGSAGDAAETARRVISRAHDYALSPEILKGILISLVNAVVKAVDHDSVPEVRLELMRFLSTTFDSAQHITSDFIETVSRLAEYFARKEVTQTDETITRITTYIDGNFNDYNLSLKLISHEFGFSPSYLTRLFKRHTGYTLKEYIDHVRIKEARDLLGNTERTLSEIIEATGFLDKSNFCRKFKQMEGVSPLKYRSMVTAT